MPPPTPKIDKILAANLGKARMAEEARPYFFALVLKGGGTSGKLLVDRLKIKDKPIIDAKKATGGSAVVIGVCYYDRKLSKLVFETNKPALPTWAQLVKRLAKDEAGLSIEPKFILAKRKLEQIKEPERDKKDEQGEPEEDSAQEKSALEQWNLQLESLRDKLKEADKSGKPWAKDLVLKLSEAGTMYRQGHQDQAGKMLVEVELLFKQKQSAAASAGANGPQAAPVSMPQAGSADPKGPAGQGASTQNAEANWKKALAETEPAYLQGLRARPDDASKLRAVMGFAQGKAEKGDFPGALAALKALKDLLAKSPAAATGAKTTAAQPEPKRPAATATEAAAATSAEAQREEQRLRKRLESLKPRLEAVRQGGGNPAAELQQLLAMFENQLRATDFKRAEPVLGRIERLLDEAEEADASFKRSLAEAMAAVGGAGRIVDEQLSALEEALKGSDDPELKAIGEAGLRWITGDHGRRLEAVIRDVEKAGPAARAAAADRALQVVGAYLDHIETSEEIDACDRNDLGVQVDVGGTLGHALGELGNLLSRT